MDDLRECPKCGTRLRPTAFSPGQRACKACRARAKRDREAAEQRQRKTTPRSQLAKDRAKMRHWAERRAEEMETLARAETVEAAAARGEYLHWKPPEHPERREFTKVHPKAHAQLLSVGDAARARIEFFTGRIEDMLASYNGCMELPEEKRRGERFKYLPGDYQKQAYNFRWMEEAERAIAEGRALHRYMMEHDPEYRQKQAEVDARRQEFLRGFRARVNLMTAPPRPPAADFEITPRTPRVRLWHAWHDHTRASPQRDPRTQQRQIEQDMDDELGLLELWSVRRPLLEQLIEATDRGDTDAAERLENALEATNTFTLKTTEGS